MKTLEDAVCMTAVFAAIFDFPISFPVSGWFSVIPLSISALRMNQLFAKPPAAHAIVLVAAFSNISFGPVAAADLLRLI